MKFLLCLLLTTVIAFGVYANDQSCETAFKKPLSQQLLLLDETDKPAELTLTETKSRLKQSQNTGLEDHAVQDENSQSKQEKINSETDKKESRLGGIFDILLPSKLRNPVR